MEPIIVSFFDNEWRLRYVLDNYISLIWTERWNGVGEFEIYAEPIEEVIYMIANRYSDPLYVTIPGSPAVMIVEKLGIETDEEDGDRILIAGRSAESLLERRIVNGPIDIGHDKGTLDDLKYLCYYVYRTQFIDRDTVDRKIMNYEWQDDPDTYEHLTSEDNFQFNGETVYSAIKSMCEAHHMDIHTRQQEYTYNAGSWLKPNWVTITRLCISPYWGVDRTWDNALNTPYVTFSDNMGNIKSFTYSQDLSDYKNMIYVHGETDHYKANYRVADTMTTGLSRRELFMDASHVTDDVPDGKGESFLGGIDFEKRLQTKGLEELRKHSGNEELDMDVDTFQYKPNEDYFVGDLVNVRRKFGLNMKARIKEITYKLDTSGYNVYPKIEMLEFQ